MNKKRNEKILVHKRGLSEVITIVLIMLIVLILIGILWVFIQPSITKTFGDKDEGGEVRNFIGCVDLKLKSSDCNALDNGMYEILVERGAGETEFKEIVFKFKTANDEFILSNNTDFPREFGSVRYKFDLSGITDDEIKSIDVASIIGDGVVCGFSGLASACSAGGDGGGGGGGGTQGLSYCAPDELLPGNNRSILGAYSRLNSLYPVGNNLGVRSVPQISDLNINGVNVKVITFRFRPFEPSYNNAPFTSNWEAEAVLLVPDPSIRQINKNTLALSMQPGTSGGSPLGTDPVRNANEIPSWYAGTDTQGNFQKSFGSVVAEFNVPMVFYGVVPAGSGRWIQFTPAIQSKLNALAQERSPTFLCDDNECSGQLTSEPIVHGCLNTLSFVDYNDGWPYIDQHPTLFYSVAASRLIDVSQAVLNQTAIQGNWRDSQDNIYSFNFNNVIAMGGSKRGSAMEEFIVAEPRVKAGLIGHANAGNYLDLLAQRISLFGNTYPSDVYKRERDELVFSQGKEKWLDYYDPVKWDINLWNGKIVARSFGSIDTFYAEGAESLFINSMPSNLRLLAVPNYGHGFGTVDHAILFRTLVNKTLAGNSDYLKVDAKYYLENEIVNATITGTNDFSDVRVELWCTQGDLDDYPPFNNNRNAWPPTLRNRNIPPTCPSLNNEDTDFNPVAPDLRYSYMENITMDDLGNGRYSANVNSISDVGWPEGANNYIGCYVRAVKGGQYKDASVATSTFLINEPLCEASLLEIKPDN